MKLSIILKLQRSLYVLKIRDAETKEILTKSVTSNSNTIITAIRMTLEDWSPEDYNIINRTNLTL